MKNFGYCIWLQVQNPDSIYKATFPLHLTLEKDIQNIEEAVKRYFSWKQKIKVPIQVRLNQIYNEYEDNFAALYYFVNAVE